MAATKPRQLSIRDAAIRERFTERAKSIGVAPHLLLERLAVDFLDSELCANCSIQGRPGTGPVRWYERAHVKGYLCAACRERSDQGIERLQAQADAPSIFAKPPQEASVR